MKCIRILVLILIAVALSSHAQNTLVPAEYSFTISGSQIWTDTGVDLTDGDEITLSAQRKPETDATCSPQGFTSTAGDWSKIPLPSVPAGALIARLAEKSDPVLVGDESRLKTVTAGHLFLGVNENVPSNCAFTVKARITHAQAASVQTVSMANQPPQNAATPNKAAPNTGDPAQHTALKDQLSSAAQVWLKGQFGSSTSSGSTQTSNAVSSNAAATATAVAGMKLPTVILDADLRATC
jgi:hypothetical protein